MKVIMDTGCHAAALAAKSAKVDVVAAYPITPQTSVMEEIADMIGDGRMKARFLPVEGEHSAMAATVAASAAGSRVFTATSSQGLLYMHEILHMAAGGRLPVVMANVNRAVHAPWSIWVDHNDSLAQRDTGWVQLYVASVQEIYNTIIQAYKIAENINIPVMVNFDGFVLSHCMMPVTIIDDAMVDEFLPALVPAWKLDPQNPSSFGNVTQPDTYWKYREMLSQDTLKVADLVKSAAKEYNEITGMWDGDTFAPYKLDDAEIVILSMGSMAAEVEISVDYLREQGIKAGAMRLRMYRPFPEDDLIDLLPKDAKLVVLDRNYAFGMKKGVLFNECKSALYDTRKDVEVFGAVMGIGGIDITYKEMVDQVMKEVNK